MPAVVKIKEKKYGDAILLLARMGGVFQTRHERTLLVGPEQKQALVAAGFVEANGANMRAEITRGKKKRSS